MKMFMGMIALLVSGSAFAQSATPPQNNIEPDRMISATVKVFRAWYDKAADGTMTFNADQPCTIGTKIGVFTIPVGAVAISFDADKLLLGECKTTLHTGEPITMQIYGNLSFSTGPDGVRRESLGASYGFSQAPVDRAGNFAQFSTSALPLKDGEIMIPSPDISQSPDQLNGSTEMSASVSFTDAP